MLFRPALKDGTAVKEGVRISVGQMTAFVRYVPPIHCQAVTPFNLVAGGLHLNTVTTGPPARTLPPHAAAASGAFQGL
jgi:hypothetical protein